MKMYFVRQGTAVLVTDHCPATKISRGINSPIIQFIPRVSENGGVLRHLILDAQDLPPMLENTVYTIDV